MVLANYADEQWACYPFQDRLATDTAQGRRTVVRQLKRLQELELVTSESRYGKGRGRIGNRHYPVEDALEQLFENRENGRSANLIPERVKCQSRHFTLSAFKRNTRGLTIIINHQTHENNRARITR